MSAFAKLLTTVVGLALTLTTLGFVGTPAASAAAPTAYEKQAHQATNKQRARHDLVPLRRDGCLQRYADRQAKRMAKQRRVYHQDLGAMLRRCGLRMAGENVAMGFPTGRAVVNQGWMKSPGHRALILQGSYRIQAIGSHRGADGRRYAAQVFGRR